MKNAEILLSFMDELQRFVEAINEYIEIGIDFFLKAREWILKIISYLEKGIDKLVDLIGGRASKIDLLEFKDEDLFV